MVIIMENNRPCGSVRVISVGPKSKIGVTLQVQSLMVLALTERTLKIPLHRRAFECLDHLEPEIR